jgi:uridine phosphorylase
VGKPVGGVVVGLVVGDTVVAHVSMASQGMTISYEQVPTPSAAGEHVLTLISSAM